MDFISNKQEQIAAMLEEIGVGSIEELFSAIPSAIREPAPKEEDGISEAEGMRLMEQIAAKNRFLGMDMYLGAGAYQHHVPALVGAVTSKSQFLTSYTPYQAEASQGTLQAIFEFQSVISALTGLDVANASLYDGTTAAAEAVLMALRCNKERNKVVVAGNVHPHAVEVIETYVESHGVEIVLLPFLEEGKIDRAAFFQTVDDNTAAVLLQFPNVFGVLEDLRELTAYATSKQVLNILYANPLVYGAFLSAKEQGADIACGDGQPFGLALQFGGPYVGYIACKQELIRQLPGRLVGETVDIKGKRAFTLILQAREQHIRREKATSNICTNQALAALACLVTMLWYGKEGVKRLALTNYQRANYLKLELAKLPGVQVSSADTFNEFAVSFSKPLDLVFAHFRKAGIEPGIPLSRFYPHMKDKLLVAVTELKLMSDLDRFIKVAKEIT